MNYLREALDLKEAGLATWRVGQPRPARELARLWSTRERSLSYYAARGYESEAERMYLSARDLAKSLRALGDGDYVVASCYAPAGAIQYNYQVFGTVDGVWLSALRFYSGFRSTAVSEASGTWTLEPHPENFREICMNMPIRVTASIILPGIFPPDGVIPRHTALWHLRELLKLRFEPEVGCESGAIVSLSGCRNLPPNWPQVSRRKSSELTVPQ